MLVKTTTFQHCLYVGWRSAQQRERFTSRCLVEVGFHRKSYTVDEIDVKTPRDQLHSTGQVSTWHLSLMYPSEPATFVLGEGNAIVCT
jgi:hypothetical protein